MIEQQRSGNPRRIPYASLKQGLEQDLAQVFSVSATAVNVTQVFPGSLEYLVVGYDLTSTLSDSQVQALAMTARVPATSAVYSQAVGVNTSLGVFAVETLVGSSCTPLPIMTVFVTTFLLWIVV